MASNRCAADAAGQGKGFALWHFYRSSLGELGDFTEREGSFSGALEKPPSLFVNWALLSEKK